MRRHGSMMVVLSGLLAASLAIGLPVGSAYADEPTDGTGAGTSAHGGVGFVGGQGPRAENRVQAHSIRQGVGRRGPQRLRHPQ